MKRALIIFCLLLFAVTAYTQDVTQIRSKNSMAGYLRFYEEASGRTVFVVAPYYFYDEFETMGVDTSGIGAVPGAYYVNSAVNSGTFASGTTNKVLGTGLLTTGAADNDDVEVSSYDANYAGSLKMGFEVTFANSDSSATAFNILLSNVNAAGTDSLVYGIRSATADTLYGSPGGTLTDAVGFVYDPDAVNAVVYGASTIAGTDNTLVTCRRAPADAEIMTVRMELDAAFTAHFYVNDVSYGSTATALTSTTALYLYIGAINRGAGADTFTIYDIRMWGDGVR